MCVWYFEPFFSSYCVKNKKKLSHPSRVSIRGCDDQAVLIRALPVQRLPQKQEADPAETVKGDRGVTSGLFV